MKLSFLVVIQDLSHKYIRDFSSSKILKRRYVNMLIFITNLMKYGGQTFFSSTMFTEGVSTLYLEKFLASLRCTLKSSPVSDSDGDIQIKVTFLGGSTLPTFHHIWLNKYVFELGLLVSGFTLCSHIIKFGLQCPC